MYLQQWAIVFYLGTSLFPSFCVLAPNSFPLPFDFSVAHAIPMGLLPTSPPPMSSFTHFTSSSLSRILTLWMVVPISTFLAS